MSVAARLRVYVVDDHKDTVVSASLLLGIAGHEVRWALDGRTALEQAPLFQPDVMLIDLAMPDFDGLRLAKELRQMRELSGVALIAVSGYPDHSHRELAREAGFDDFLAKPYSMDELSAVLERARTSISRFRASIA
jgi:DNA-binding response OmpR family regulator